MEITSLSQMLFATILRKKLVSWNVILMTYQNAVAHVKVKTYSNSATKIEVTIPLKNVTLRAEERNDDLYAGIDLINNKLERQVRKYKTRINRKSRDRGDQEVFVAELQEMQETQVDNDAYDDNEIEIIRSKEFSLKPMDSEEAVLQMNLLGHDFFCIHRQRN